MDEKDGTSRQACRRSWELDAVGWNASGAQAFNWRRCTQHRAALPMEDAMQRMFIFAMAMWLGSLAAANAQTATQPSAPQIGQPLPQAGVAATAMDNSSSLLMSPQSGSTGAASSLGATSSAISATASDPLAVPTSTLPSAGQTTTGSA